MGNLPKHPGDAVLGRDGAVKVNGKKVGYWSYEAPDIMPPTYHFSLERNGDIVFSRMFKHLFKAELPDFIEGRPSRKPPRLQITPDMLVFPRKKNGEL